MANSNQNSNNTTYTAGLPSPQSYEQILSTMLSTYVSLTGISDLNTASAVTSFFETVALAVARSSGDSFQILTNFSIDRATGYALQNLAIENGVTPTVASPATGNVSVIDSSFNKISTQVYAGSNPPNKGSTSINVSNASSFPASGSIYIGRGTPDIEGPIAYSSITAFGGYYIINLTGPTTKFHNVGESVILSQGGNRSIPANTIVIAPGTGNNPNVQYSVITSATILDGETTVTNVGIAAITPGSLGNVPAGSITQFASPPFFGATVTNPLSFTNGEDTETDDQLRVSIKAALASTGLGTATAVASAVLGATTADGTQTIVSDNIVTNTDGSSTLYIDNGTGYEATWQGVGLEYIISNALGGEQFFQLATGGSQAPIAKAFLESSLAAPFDLIGGDTLAIVVGEQVYQHVFATSDFMSPGAATAYEVTASINADTTLGFNATTAANGTYVVISSVSESPDSLQIALPTTSGRDASVLLGLPSSQAQTLRLYKNGTSSLSKDGNIAEVFTQSQSLWSNSIVSGATLILSVDGTSPITYTILNSDFIATGLYTNVASTNSLVSWQQVLQNKLVGVTIKIIGSQLSIQSNLGANNRAQISISSSSSLVVDGMFGGTQLLSSQGKASDFTLDRNTGQFELVKPLVAGDTLTAGNNITTANVQSAAIPSGNFTLSSEGHLWILIDNQGALIPTGVVGNSLLSVSQPSTNVVRYTSSISTAFENVHVGDYVIVWSAELNTANQIEGRVYATNNTTTLDILVTSAEYAAIVPQNNITFQNGFVVLRSTLAPQKFALSAGTYALSDAVIALQTQTNALYFSVYKEQYISISSNTKSADGSIFIVTSDAQGSSLGFVNGSSSVSEYSLLAFYDSNEYDAELPLFIHSEFASDGHANTPDSFIPSISSSVSLNGIDPNQLISILQPYGSSEDAQPAGEHSQIAAIVGGTTIDLAYPGANSYVINTNTYITNEYTSRDIRRLRSSVDRYFLASPLDFSNNDSAVVVLDGNSTLETFSIPFYRPALTNTGVASNSTTFNAYDVNSGPTANFTSSFGPFFDFSNFKVYMQAKKVLKPSPSQTALLYRSTEWGRSGQYINVGYVYPTVANSAIGSTVTVNTSTTILINLKSGTAIPTSIDGSTAWNIAITSNTPSAGIDQVTFTWSGTGTAPALTLSGGEYVNIGTNSGFNIANTGIFRVSTQSGFSPTSTSFTVQMPTGMAVAQSGALTLVPGAIAFYNSSTTTASQINTYINANLSAYISSTIVNDGGMTGAGVIGLSTYEDSGFSYKTVYLLDGINWISTSNISATPQFTLKVPLSLPTDIGYAFNNGENLIFVPTTMNQVSDLISISAVTGFSTMGSINVANRSSILELSTNTLGSGGSIQIIGGSGNSYTFPVLESALRLNNTYQSVFASSVASENALSDQWFRLQASNAQNKQTLFNSNTIVSTINNTPLTGQSTIELGEKELTQRYFGKPRYHIRSQGDTFRVEKQGSLTCLSWNPNIGSSPMFDLSSINFNASGGGTLNVSAVSGTNDFLYTILTGSGNFNGLSIGDLVTISGLPISANNGTFLVDGVSLDGTQLQVLNPTGQNEFSKGSFTFSGGNSTAGDIYSVNGVNYIVGYTFALGLTADDTASNFAATLASLPNTTTTVSSNIVTVTSTLSIPTTTVNYDGSPVVTDSANFTMNVDPVTGDTYTVNNTNFVAGINFAIDELSIPNTASNLAAQINTLSNVLATATGNVVSVVSTISDTAISITYKGSNSTTVSAVFTLNSNNTQGDIFNLGGNFLIAGVSFAVGATLDITAQNLSAAIGALSGLTSTYSGNVVTVYGTHVGQSYGLSYTGTPVITVSAGGNLIGDSYSGSTFFASTAVSEGDTLYIVPSSNSYNSPFNPLNQGRFRVIRRFNDSVWYENDNSIQEEVSLPYNPVSLDFDLTTTFTINASNHTLLLTWTGNFTAPSLQNAQVGDIITLSESLLPSGDKGSFMVLDSGESLPQITQLYMPTGSIFPTSGTGSSFLISSGGNVYQYQIWFNTGSNTAPSAVGGYTLVPVSITSVESSASVANALNGVLSGLSGLSSSVSNNIVTVTSTVPAPTIGASNINVPSPFSITITQEGQYTYLECLNPGAVNQSSFAFTSLSNFLCHRPQIQFYEYQATVPGDKLVISGTALGSSNVGIYSIVNIPNVNTAIISGSLSNISNASLNGQISSLNVLEGVSYTGYKQIYLIAQSPGIPNQNTIILTTNNQYESINQSAGITFTSLNKLNFDTLLKNGLDSYSYNTGLIQLANQIVYGDTRDAVTFPGVAAAGAQIYIKAPLAKRIQVSIDVRLNTGVPFAQMVSQIQSTVGSLIQANPIGQSIAISAIVSAVNSVPGVYAVSISSPQYSPTNDLIFLAPSEKAIIIDSSVDVVVNQIT